jgi:hypothetical protein
MECVGAAAMNARNPFAIVPDNRRGTQEAFVAEHTSASINADHGEARMIDENVRRIRSFSINGKILASSSVGPTSMAVCKHSFVTLYLHEKEAGTYHHFVGFAALAGRFVMEPTGTPGSTVTAEIWYY